MINHEQQPYLSLREQISGFLKPKFPKETFWALNDVSFDVMPGDSIGIIGKNGAGKSTLLKILSKITPPTSGKITSRGRIASLLEVGTGFHPELSGRENIFMNGSILGMRKKEIQKNFDAIVDFAGVEKFIDTPLKHYSSGMQLRLAFAVAAFLENEILIIDEVLAVGDAEFQKKCMGKMEDVSNSGRTVLFVSHNLNALQSLCPKAVILQKGEVAFEGNSSEAVKKYLSSTLDANQHIKYNPPLGDEYCQLLSVGLLNINDEPLNNIAIDNEFKIKITYQINKTYGNSFPHPNIHVKTIKGEYVLVSSTDKNVLLSETGIMEAYVSFPANFLNAETYIVGVALSTFTPIIVHCFDQEAIQFEVNEDINKRNVDYLQDYPGVIRPKLVWQNKLIKKI